MENKAKVNEEEEAGNEKKKRVRKKGIYATDVSALL